MTVPLPPPLPATAAATRGPVIPAFAWARRHRHVTVPVLGVLPVSLAAAEMLAHLPASGVPTVTASVALGGSVYVMAPHKWTGDDGEPRWAEVWYARLSAIAAGSWLSVAAFTGVHIPQLIALGPLALAWGIPWYIHKHPRRNRGEIADLWNQWWQHYAPGWGLPGSHVVEVETQGVIDTLTVQLWAGHQTLRDVQEILHKLESALQGHVAPGMTRCETAGGRGDLVLVHLKRANPHDVEVEWEPELAPVSITSEMPLGKDEHGEWVMIPCMALSWFIIGALGGGKSNELSVMLASITGCPDARVWLIDRKGGKAARPWLGAVDWVATTVEEARLMLQCFRDEMRARALDGYDGSESLVPTPEVPAIFLVIDEAHNVVSSTPAGDPLCQSLLSEGASECRSTAGRVVVLTQYGALPESVGTDQTRGNLLNRICFRVSDPAHGQFALTDWAKLDASKLENPGEFFYRMEKATASAPARGPHLPHEQVREIAAANAQIERPALALFATEWQETYNMRHLRLPAAFRAASPSPAAAAPAPAPPPQDAPPEWAAEALERVEEAVASVPDLPAPPKLTDAQLAQMRATTEGQKQLWAHLLQHAPAEGITPKALMTGTGLHNSWTHLYLGVLQREGVITRPSRGKYLPAGGRDVWAELQRIMERDERQAREMAGAA